MIRALISALLAGLMTALMTAAVLVPTTNITSTGVEQSLLPVSVEPNPLVLSCLGPHVRLGGESGAEVGTVELIDRAELTLVSPGIVRTSETDWRRIESRDSAQGSDSFSGYQYQVTDVPRLAGESLTNCQTGKSESWLMAGSTQAGNESLLILTNPDSVSALVRLDFYGSEGLVSQESTAIAAAGVELINLARFTPNEAAVGVRISSQGGRVAAFMQHKSNTGLSATGISVSSAWQTAAESDVLSVLVGDQEFAPADRAPVAYLLNPATEPVAATVSATSSTGGFGSVYRLNLKPGVSELVLDDLESGIYHLAISAESEVLASVFAGNSLLGDFNWQAQAETFSRDLLTSSAVSGFITVKANSDSIILVRSESDDGVLETASRLALKSGESTVVPISGGAMVRIQGSDFKASIGTRDASVGMTLFENRNTDSEFSFRVY